MHPPRDVYRLLGMSTTSLRRYSNDFSDFLSPTAGASLSESGHPTQRRYTDQDVALLAAIKQAYDAGTGREEILIRLRRGTLEPAHTHVVVGYASDTTRESSHFAATEPPMATSLPAIGSVGGFEGQELMAAWTAFLQAAPQMSQALIQLQTTTDALHETTVAQRALLQDLQAERAAIEELRAERDRLAADLAPATEAKTDSPSVPNPERGGSQAPMTWGERVKRLFTGEA